MKNLGFEAPRHEEWLTRGPEVLGLQIGERGADGTVHLRMDDRHRRLSIHPGQEERPAYVGWELAGKAAFTDAVAELEAKGYAPRLGTAKDCAQRQVQRLARFEDPYGFPHEIFYGPVFTAGSFLPGKPMTGQFVGAWTGSGTSSSSSLRSRPSWRPSPPTCSASNCSAAGRPPLPTAA